MYGELPSYKVIAENDQYILIIDLDRGMSVTTGAEQVIEHLNSQINQGIGDRQVFYRDTDGHFDELKVKDGQFTGYAPCSDSQQIELAKLVVKLTILNPNPTKMTHDRANQLAAELTAQDSDGWRYSAAHPHNGQDGQSQVLVYDNNDELVGIL